MDFLKAGENRYKLMRGGWLDTRDRLRVIIKMGDRIYFEGYPDAIKFSHDGILYSFKSGDKCYSTHITNVLMIEDYKEGGEINES